MIHRIRLTRHGTRHMRDLQVTHATIAAATHGTTARPLWCMPLRDLLIVRADQCDLPSALVREAHTGVHVPALDAGDPVTLTTVVNPVVDRDGRRRVIPIGDTRAWLEHRLAPVELRDVEVEDLGQRGGWRGGRRVTVAWRAVTSTGIVRDPDGLAEVLDRGLGRAKAYGCGLVLVAGAS